MHNFADGESLLQVLCLLGIFCIAIGGYLYLMLKYQHSHTYETIEFKRSKSQPNWTHTVEKCTECGYQHSYSSITTPLDFE